MGANLMFLLLFVTISATLAQTEYKFLTEFKLTLREERIPAIVTSLLNNSLELYDVKTQDIIKLSKLDQYSFDQIGQVFNYFNLTIKETFTVGNLEQLLKTFNLQFGDFFRNFTSKLGFTSTQTQQIVRDLSIPPDFWIDISLNQDDGIYNSLKQGIYDEEHVAAALITSGRTRNEVYNAARDIILTTVLQLKAGDFMGVLKQYGWDRRLAFKLYEALNITTEDVYGVEKFRNVLNSIVDDLNANGTSGVFVGPNQLAVHRLVFEDLSRKVDNLTVKVEAGGLQVILRKNSSFGDSIVELITVNPTSAYIKIVDNYTVFENCVYVSIKNGTVREAKVETNGLSVKKDDTIRFIVGSPLICNSKLYGLAKAETESEILFDGFYTEDSPPPDDHNDLENRVYSMSPFLGLVFNLIALVLCTH